MAKRVQIIGEARQKADILIDRFDYCDKFRSQYDDIAREDWALYVGERPELPPELQGRSNLHIPRLTEVCDTLRARTIKAYLGSKPYADFIPRPRRGATIDQMVMAAEKAELAAALVDGQIEDSGIVKVLWNWLTTLYTHPASIMECWWDYREEEVEEEQQIVIPLSTPFGVIQVPTTQIAKVTHRLADDNRVRYVDYYDFWADPHGYDLDSARFCFQRRWYTREQLEQRLGWLRDGGMGKVYNVDFDKLAEAGGADIKEGRWERQLAQGLSPETKDVFWHEQEDRAGELIELLEYWEDDRFSILGNREFILYDGANPYPHRKKPFIFDSFEPVPGELYGRSLVRLMADLQRELNTQRNQRIDAVSWHLSTGYKVLRDADIQEEELVRKPFQIIYVDRMDEVMPLEHTEVPTSAFTEEQIIKQDMEGVVGTPNVFRGANTATQKTATETQNVVNSASSRFEVRVMLHEDWIRRLAYLFDMNNQHLMDEARLVRLYGKSGVDAWKMVDPDDIQGEWDYRPACSSSDPAANKEVRRAQLTELLTMAIKTGNPYVDKKALTKFLLESYDVRNVESLLMDDERQIQQSVEQAVTQMKTQALIRQAQAQILPPPPPQQMMPGQVPGGPQGAPQGPQPQMTPEQAMAMAEQMIPPVGGGGPVAQV